MKLNMSQDEFTFINSFMSERGNSFTYSKNNCITYDGNAGNSALDPYFALVQMLIPNNNLGDPITIILTEPFYGYFTLPIGKVVATSDCNSISTSYSYIQQFELKNKKDKLLNVSKLLTHASSNLEFTFVDTWYNVVPSSKVRSLRLINVTISDSIVEELNQMKLDHLFIDDNCNMNNSTQIEQTNITLVSPGSLKCLNPKFAEKLTITGDINMLVCHQVSSFVNLVNLTISAKFLKTTTDKFCKLSDLNMPELTDLAIDCPSMKIDFTDMYFPKVARASLNTKLICELLTSSFGKLDYLMLGPSCELVKVSIDEPLNVLILDRPCYSKTFKQTNKIGYLVLVRQDSTIVIHKSK